MPRAHADLLLPRSSTPSVRARASSPLVLLSSQRAAQLTFAHPAHSRPPRSLPGGQAQGQLVSGVRYSQCAEVGCGRWWTSLARYREREQGCNVYSSQGYLFCATQRATQAPEGRRVRQSRWCLQTPSSRLCPPRSLLPRPQRFERVLVLRGHRQGRDGTGGSDAGWDGSGAGRGEARRASLPRCCGRRQARSSVVVGDHA